ncbi:MAG: L-rhamnose mutarotase [Asticcacaulis sp.]|uniref:L-rhamnose mutarotase n=1 Tax=Asticcacaulis sp. TaxID=1872648 RepID=UPI003F7C2300
MATPLYYVLDLKDDPQLIADYQVWHRPGGPPQAITDALRAADIVALDIFLAGNRLMMALTPGPGFDPAAKAASDAASPEVQAWEELMWRFQQALPFAAPGQKWVPMQRIYALSEQP